MGGQVSTVENVNGSGRPAAPAAEAEALRGKEEVEKQRIANERAQLKLEKDKVAHERYVAEQRKKAAEAAAAAKKAEKEEADKEEAEAKRAAEQERSERLWKWGARGIYATGLVIAAPIQFLHFWDPARKFMIAAPVLLEGLALVLAFGAAWAVAHRRDVAPYRVGIMIGSLIAAAINLHGGMSSDKIGLNAGLIGAIASLGGPIVLMAYEHGIAQKADGIPSYRERSAAKKAKKEREEEKTRAKAEREEAAKKAAADKAAKEEAAKAEQERKDADRKKQHPDVWEVAESLRSARGAEFVTEQIWGDAWYLVTGSKKVGITPDIEAGARAAQARMKEVTGGAESDENALVDSQKVARSKRGPDEPDGRRFNGGTPPRRAVGDTQPYTDVARRQASHEQTAKSA
jgi:Skp family chaperone for outer membrane proteins